MINIKKQGTYFRLLFADNALANYKVRPSKHYTTNARDERKIISALEPERVIPPTESLLCAVALSVAKSFECHMRV